MRPRRTAFISCSLWLAVGAAWGQAPSEPKPGTPEEAQKGAGQAPGADATKPKQPPTLDELLGLKPDPGAGTPSDDLTKKLAEEEPGDLFLQAISLMESSSKRLEGAQDTGLETQRTQEDTLRKLDQLISSMQKRQQQKQQQQQQQQQQNKDSQKDQQQQQQQQSAQRDASEQKAMDSKAVDPPGRKDGKLRPGLEAAKAAWGSLPARIREMLLQGSGEKFSSTYERMTEEYYRKLAEQK